MLGSHILSAFLQADPESLLAAGLSSMLQGAKNAFNDVLKDLNPVNEVEKTLKDFANDLYEKLIPDPDGLKEVVDRVKQLYEDVKTEGETVYKNIADEVNNALSSGQIPEEGDAGLGQTHDNFTPGGDQFSVGQTPGIDIGGVGLNRTGDDGGVSYGGDSGSGSAGSSPTPLGVSGSGTTPSGGSSSTSVQPPTASDLGLDPNSGAYVEYQPNQGQVQITYPDGTTETRPWPPR
jgi:hypothetical protein